MSRQFATSGVWSLAFLCVSTSLAAAAELRGCYMEARTCQVYTGPCFANGETGLTGKDAVMAWRIETGDYQGVELAGLNAVAVLRTAETLGFRGLQEAKQVRAMVVLDQRAKPKQREALLQFVEKQLGRKAEHVRDETITMKLDKAELAGQLQAGKSIYLKTRKARPGDCICSNEAAYYPPLAKVEHFAPGVTIDGQVTARPLGTRWTSPNRRNAYMATFALE